MMALKIICEAPLGPGHKAFRFLNHEDRNADQMWYEDGRALEKARFREGSLGQKIFERLSSRSRLSGERAA